MNIPFLLLSIEQKWQLLFFFAISLLCQFFFSIILWSSRKMRVRGLVLFSFYHHCFILLLWLLFLLFCIKIKTSLLSRMSNFTRKWWLFKTKRVVKETEMWKWKFFLRKSTNLSPLNEDPWIILKPHEHDYFLFVLYSLSKNVCKSFSLLFFISHKTQKAVTLFGLIIIRIVVGFIIILI